MFTFVKERKAVAALESLSPGIQEFAAGCTPVERAAALAAANAMLITGAKAWGRAYSHEPMRLGNEAAWDAVCVLADRHAGLEAAASDLVGRPASDLQASAWKWDTLATQVVMVTVGCSLDRRYAAAARDGWKTLWSARRAAREAARRMDEHSRAYSVAPVPGRRTDLAYLETLASTLPPMFRKGPR